MKLMRGKKKRLRLWAYKKNQKCFVVLMNILYLETESPRGI